MPVQVTYPGVYTQVKSSGLRTISGVATSIAAFFGMASKGPIGLPKRVRSFDDYEATFGNDMQFGEMALQVRQFFLNGGSTAWITRIANGATKASLILNDERGDGNPTLKLEAIDPGRSGNIINVEVDYNTPSPDRTFNLTLYRRHVEASGAQQITDVEQHSNLSMNPGDPNFVETIVNGASSLVKATRAYADATVNAIAGKSWSGLIFADANADATAALRQKFPGPKGSFMISLDGQRPYPVEVELPAQDADAAVDLTNIQAAFKTAIENFMPADLAGTVNVALLTAANSVTGGRIFQIESPGGSVRISSAPQNDLAVPLRLGVMNNGIEFDRFSGVRPAPTGYSSVVHENPLNGDFDHLRTFSGMVKDTLDTWTVVSTVADKSLDSLSADPLSANGSMDRMYVSDADTFQAAEHIVGSFLNVKQNLETLAAVIRDNQNNIDKDLWDARVYGNRLILTPRFGLAAAGLGTTLTSTTTNLNASIFSGGPNTAAEQANVKAYVLGDVTAGRTFHAVGVPGNDGDLPIPSDYRSAWNTLERATDIFNIVILPRAVANGIEQTDDARRGLWGMVSALCRDKRSFLLVDPPVSWQCADDVDAGINQQRAGVVTTSSAIFWPRVKVTDSSGKLQTIDPAGTIAGLFSRIDKKRGVWKAGAGIEARLTNVRELEHAVTDPENGTTNDQAVNTLRSFSVGNVSWGSRTMAGFKNSGEEDAKYIPVVRLTSLILLSLQGGLKFAVFEPNDEPLWGQIRTAAGSFMNNLFRQGAFKGQKISEAYYVRCDQTTTTQSDINLGIVNVEVGFAPLKPAEFVVVTLQQIAGQVQS